MTVSECSFHQPAAESSPGATKTHLGLLRKSNKNKVHWEVPKPKREATVSGRRAHKLRIDSEAERTCEKDGHCKSTSQIVGILRPRSPYLNFKLSAGISPKPLHHVTPPLLQVPKPSIPNPSILPTSLKTCSQSPANKPRFQPIHASPDKPASNPQKNLKPEAFDPL